ELSGWIFCAHQVGSALGAALAGWVVELTGTYSSAFVSAAVLAFVAAGLAMMIREEPFVFRPTVAPAAATAERTPPPRDRTPAGRDRADRRSLRPGACV